MLPVLFIFHLARREASCQPATPCSPFNHNGHLCKHKAKVPSRAGQGYLGSKQCTQRAHLPSSAPPAPSISLPLLQSCVSSMKTFTCIDMQPESVCGGAQRWQCKQGSDGKSKQSGECQMPATSATPTLLTKRGELGKSTRESRTNYELEQPLGDHKWSAHTHTNTHSKTHCTTSGSRSGVEGEAICMNPAWR